MATSYTRWSILCSNIGLRNFSNRLEISELNKAPFSIKGTNPSPITSVIIISLVNSFVANENSSLFKVPFVARIPILLLFDCNAAGLMAGSIPINGILNLSRSTVMAFVVAVLQATTIILQPFSNNSSVFFILNDIISSFDL